MRCLRAQTDGVQIITVLAIRREDSPTLLPIMRRFNAACNWLSVIAFGEHLFHWLPLQRRAYHEVRLRFSVSAAEATVIVRKVAYAYRNKARRNTMATFRPLGSIPLSRHRYRDGKALFYGVAAAYQARPGTTCPGKPPQATLVYRDGRCFIHQVVDAPEPAPYAPTGFLGCDLGVVNILADSDGAVYSSGHLNGLRKRHAKLRSRLQQKGTRSAKRLLRKRGMREGRFARWVNHGISKQVVAKAKTRAWGIALEDLGGIRERVQVRKAQRRQHHAWAFNQLRAFITYKAALSGVPLAVVDPRNTSRTCPACGLIDKANRPNQATFLCVSCAFAGHADHVAAVNIARKAGDRRALGDAPDAAAWASCESHDGLRALMG